MDEITDLIERVLHNNATEEDRRQLARLVETDREVRHIYAHRAAVVRSLTVSFAPDEIDVDKARHRVEARLVNKSTPRHNHLFDILCRVAAILLLPLMGLSTYLWLKQSPEVGLPPIEVVAPYGTYSRLTLPDGSKVWLNAGARLSYPVRFSSGEREVHLSGEGYFEVTSNPTHPFTVHTDRLNVRATGTTFNVEDYPTDSLAFVSLTEGVVEVSSPQSSEKNVLTPNQRLTFNPRNNNVQVATADSDKWAAWRNGVVIFRDDALGYVFDRLSKTYNVNFHLKDTSIAKQRYRATFEQESLSEILRLLELSAPLKFDVKQRTRHSGGAYKRQTIEVTSK